MKLKVERGIPIPEGEEMKQQQRVENLVSALSGNRDHHTASVAPFSDLPWRTIQPGDVWAANGNYVADFHSGLVPEGRAGYTQNAEFAVHAANAYPKLVAALAEVSRLDALRSDSSFLDMSVGRRRDVMDQDEAVWNSARGLLRELGELK